MYLLGFSFALCLLAGQNYNLRHRISLYEGEGMEDGKSGVDADQTISAGELDILSKEVGRLVTVWVSEEATEGYFAKGGSITKEGIERVEMKTRDGVKEVFRKIKKGEGWEVDEEEEKEEKEGGGGGEGGYENDLDDHKPFLLTKGSKTLTTLPPHVPPSFTNSKLPSTRVLHPIRYAVNTDHEGVP